MRNKKTLQELTIKDNFMFGAVMSEPENCRLLLERILEMPIERVEVSKEKTIVYNVDYKGIRLDVYAKDEKNTRYNVEMQTVQEPGLDNRMRYYHSQIDMELLLSGLSYKELPDTYVIFICDFDPYGKGKYRYTKKSLCKEVPELSMANGAHTILLSTEGKNEDEVSQELVTFLKFVKASLSESEQDFEDIYIRRLQEKVREVKRSREMGAKYMAFWDIIEDERAIARKEAREEGHAEGHAKGLAEGLAEGKLVIAKRILVKLLNKRGVVSDELKEYIEGEKDLNKLEEWIELAATVSSIEEFEQHIK